MLASFFLLYNILPVTTTLKIRLTLYQNQETIKISPPAIYTGIFQTQRESVQEPQLSSYAYEPSPRFSVTMKLHSSFTQITRNKSKNMRISNKTYAKKKSQYHKKLRQPSKLGNTLTSIPRVITLNLHQDTDSSECGFPWTPTLSSDAMQPKNWTKRCSLNIPMHNTGKG